MDGRLIIYEHDFFTLDPSLLDERIDCVFDRGSLVAILPEERKRYGETMERFLTKNKNNFRYLLLTYDYDSNIFSGPPRAVPCGEINTMFGMQFVKNLIKFVTRLLFYNLVFPEGFANIEQLARIDESKIGKERFNLDKLIRFIHLLTRRDLEK